MSPALQAAFRLACQLPSRTHLRKEPQKVFSGGLKTPSWKEMRVREMDGEKKPDGSRRWSRRDIMTANNIGNAALLRILGRIRKNRRSR